MRVRSRLHLPLYGPTSNVCSVLANNVSQRETWGNLSAVWGQMGHVLRPTLMWDARWVSESDRNYTVRSVDRAIDVIVGLAEADAPLALTQLADLVGGSKSAIFSTIQTLVDRGFVLSTGSGMDRRYQLGLELARLGDLALQRFSFGSVAQSTLEALSRETGLTSRAAVFDDGWAVAVGRVDGRSGVRFDLRMGQRELLHSSSVGKAILSTFSDEEVLALVGPKPWILRTDKTIADEAHLLADVRETRNRGFSIDDEEDAEGILCIGAAVLDRNGHCRGAISVTRIKADISRDELQELGATVARHAHALTASLSGGEVA